MAAGVVGCRKASNWCWSLASIKLEVEVRLKSVATQFNTALVLGHWKWFYSSLGVLSRFL